MTQGPDPFLALVMSRMSAQTAQMADYQRQQLNLLRQHQGKPPIPPPCGWDPVEWMVQAWVRMMGCSVLLLFPLMAAFPPGSDLAGWSYLCIPVGFGVGLARTQRAAARARQVDWDQWVRSGCP